MPKDINDLYKELSKITKEIQSSKNEFSQDLTDIKKTFKMLDKKIGLILNKIQEFEVIMDAAELIEEHMDDEEEKYNTEWSPYTDEDYDGEDYDDYDSDNNESY